MTVCCRTVSRIDLSALISTVLRDLSGDFFAATRPFQSDLVGEKKRTLFSAPGGRGGQAVGVAHVDWRAARQAHLIIHHYRPLTS
jgi:hypothetical protein